ncbi:hypothetical protein L9F63_007580, partial [Diploptera punctata]
TRKENRRGVFRTNFVNEKRFLSRNSFQRNDDIRMLQMTFTTYTEEREWIVNENSELIDACCDGNHGIYTFFTSKTSHCDFDQYAYKENTYFGS